MITGLILLTGNILVTQIWFTLAERTREEHTIRFAAKTASWLDVVFTAPGIAMTVFSGAVLAQSFGGEFSHTWSLMAFICFITSGVIWILILVPSQNYMAKRAESKQKLNQAFYSVLHRWYVFGFTATLLVFFAVASIIFFS